MTTLIIDIFKREDYNKYTFISAINAMSRLQSSPERVSTNIFEGKILVESAESVIGKLLTLPNLVTQGESIHGRIVEVMLFHELGSESNEIERSRIRENFEFKKSGDVVVGPMQVGHYIAIKAGGPLACFRIDALKDPHSHNFVAEKPSALSKLMGLNKQTRDALSSINLFDPDNKILFLEDDGFTPGDLETTYDSHNQKIVRKLRLR